MVAAVGAGPREQASTYVLLNQNAYSDTQSNSWDCSKLCACGNILTAAEKRSRFFRRFLNYRQMDFQFAFAQLGYLFFQPQKIYRGSKYRSTTHNQWARNDPAFFILACLLYFVTVLFYTMQFNANFSSVLRVTFYSLLVDLIITSVVISTLLWLCVNKWLLSKIPLTRFTNYQAQNVEWGYCLDIHMNAVVPAFVLIHLISGTLNYFRILPVFVNNAIWLAAGVYYTYITFLGYNALPTIEDAKVFLLPFSVLAVLYVVFAALHFDCYVHMNQIFYLRLHNH